MLRIRFKKLTSALLVLTLLLGIAFGLPVSASAGELDASFEDGDQNQTGDLSNTSAKNYNSFNMNYSVLPDGTRKLLSPHPSLDDKSDLHFFDDYPDVSIVGENCFTGNTTLKNVALSTKVKSIEDKAFSNCSALKSIEIPQSVTSIGKDVFKGCAGLTIYAAPGSAGYNYAIENGITCKTIDINKTHIRPYYSSEKQDAKVNVFRYYGNDMLFDDAYITDDKQSFYSDYDFLVDGRDYTYEFTVDSKTLTGTFVLKGIGMYSGSFTETRQFYPVNSMEYQSASADISFYNYDGTAKTPKISVCTIHEYYGNYSSPVYLVEGKDYTVEYFDNVEVGIARAEITGIGKYTGQKTVKFTVGKNLINDYTMSYESVVYDGTEKQPEAVVNVKGKTLEKGIDYTVEYQNNIDVGTAWMYVRGINRYTALVPKPFKIEQRDLKDVNKQLSSDKFTYDGKAKTPKMILSCGSYVLKEGDDYTLSYSNNTNAGTGTVTAIGRGNFKGVCSSDFEIKAGIHSIDSCKITVTSNGIVYTGNPQKPSVSVKDGTTVLTEGKDYDISCTSNVNAGYASVSITGKGNYTGTVTKNYYIAPQVLDSTMLKKYTINATYDGTAKTGSYILNYIQGELVEGVDYKITCSNNTNVGQAKVLFEGIGNFSGSFTHYFNINPRSIKSAHVTVSPKTFVYNGDRREPSVTVMLAGKELEKDVDYTVSYANNINVGEASVIIKGIGNYSEEQQWSFNIENPSVSSLVVTVNDNNDFLYNGQAKTPSVTVKNGTKILTKDTDYTVSYSNNINVGTASVTVKGKNSYSGSITKYFNITPRHLYYANASLSQTSYTYDGTEKKPSVTVKYNSTNLVSGQDYTVTYSDNKVPGIALATLTGKGNYSGTKTLKFNINKPPSKFTWGADNWNFNNSSKNFSRIYYVNDSIKTKWQKDFGLSNYDITLLEDKIAKKNADKGFGGSCYGMTSTEMLAKYNILDLSYYGLNKNINTNSPSNSNVISLINCFQWSQATENGINNAIRRQAYNTDRFTQSDYISQLESYLSSGGKMLNVFFAIQAVCKRNFMSDNKQYYKGEYINDGYHSILAYGIESCKKKWEEYTGNIEYDRKILIADPNALANNNVTDEYCIYYRTSDHSWIIPHYCKWYNDNMQDVCYWTASGSLREKTGFIYGLYDYNGRAQLANVMSTENADHYIAGISAENDNGEEARVSEISSGNSNMAFAAENSDADDTSGIRKYNLPSIGDDADNTERFALWNPSSSYSLAYDDPAKISVNMDYRDIAYSTDLSNAEYVSVAPGGYISAEGSNSDYELKMITEDNACVTDWFMMSVSGSKINDVSLNTTDNGYILNADNLNNVTVFAKGSDCSASCKFSASGQRAYIYEINKSTIGVKVDSDNNGTFETDVKTISKLISECTVKLSSNVLNYNSDYQVPQIEVKDGTKTLVENHDYEISVDNGISSGVSHISITGKNTYSGKKVESYFIKGDYQLGDVDNSGGTNPVTAADRAKITRYVAKWNDSTEYFDATLADVNLDGKIDALDRIIITRYVAKCKGYGSLPIFA